MLINTKKITDLYGIYYYRLEGETVKKYSRFTLGNAKPEEIEAALNFKTKDEYLQWVRDWKKTYTEISNEIHCYKKARKHSSEPYKGSIGDEAASYARGLGWEATALLEARRQAKKRSWELRTARLVAEAIENQ
jgi:hypothetical protein